MRIYLIDKYIKAYKFSKKNKDALYSLEGVKNLARAELTIKEYQIFNSKIAVKTIIPLEATKACDKTLNKKSEVNKKELKDKA